MCAVTKPPDLIAARKTALGVTCRHTRCDAAIGNPCTNPITGEPLQHLPAHQIRLTDSGAHLAPQGEPQPAGLPDQRRRHHNDQSRHQLEQRRRELQCDVRAGDMTEAKRAELIQLDAVLGTPDTAIPPTTPETPTWVRGPRGVGA